MRYWLLIAVSAIFFVLVNTIFLWEDKVGLWLMVITIVLFLSFLTLLIWLLWHIGFGIKERFKDRQRNIATAMVALILLLVFLQPFGFVNQDDLEGEDLFIAQREGSANCMTVFKIKENNRFVEKTLALESIELEVNII